MLKLNNEMFPKEARSKWETKEIVKAIHRSQHTQRNYDLSKSIPTEDIKTLVTAATQCPSKQNVAFYDLHVVLNQNVIKSIYEFTTDLHSDDEAYKGLSNPQILSNAMFVFSKKPSLTEGTHKEIDESSVNQESLRIAENDTHTAIGLAAGYVNLSASLLGLETGCCSCVMNYDALKEILQIEGEPVLLMGIGYKNDGVNRRVHGLKGTSEHQENGWKDTFVTFKKEQIRTYLVK